LPSKKKPDRRIGDKTFIASIGLAMGNKIVQRDRET
jgi:hypothetical protein